LQATQNRINMKAEAINKLDLLSAVQDIQIDIACLLDESLQDEITEGLLKVQRKSDILEDELKAKIEEQINILIQLGAKRI